MYLCKVELGPRATCAVSFWKDVTTDYGAHQAIWRLFGGGAERPRDFLYRHDNRGGRLEFLVLAPREPTGDEGGLWRIEAKQFAPRLLSGQRLGFRLRANPVVRRGEGPAGSVRRGKRHDVVMNAKRRLREGGGPRPDEATLIYDAGLAWLKGQGERSGFRLAEAVVETIGADGLFEEQGRPAVRISGYRQHRIRRPGAGSPSKEIRFSTLDLEGVLEVTNPSIFLERVTAGFGPQKAFGCGLMLLRRA